MQHIYTVPNEDALAVYEPEIRSGIDVILKGAREQGNNNRTAEDVWEEIQEHVRIAPDGCVWLTIDAGVLVSWVTGKIYVDGKKRNGCITWAWAAPQCQVSREIVATAEAYFRERECQAAYMGRAFLQPAFTRLMRRYGYVLSTVVYEKRLDREVHDGDSLRPPGGEIREYNHERDGKPVPAEGSDAPATADVRPAEPGIGRADGEAAGDGSERPDATGHLDDAGNGTRDAASGGATGGAAERTGTDADGWHWSGGSSPVVAPGSESTGTPDAGTAGPPEA